jgi:outer membrane receptor protein involved in Fe transport
MRKSMWLVSAGLFAISAPAFAQDATQGSSSTAAEGPTEAAAVEEPAPDTAQEQGSIIVTATRRNEALSDVPLAVSAVSADTLENSGITDIRQLNQVSPSLMVSSSSTEAGAGAARIRGVGTVGDNPGLESSVGVFIDGVYRSRVGVGLTELGAVDRIEVLRGPQGTLFGRNTSSGLIHIITAKPRFTTEITGEATIGNYDLRRFEVGVTGALTDSLAARIDGVYMKRDGFLEDDISGRDVNDRNRYLLRGQLLYQPTDDLSIRFIADYADRDEECCAAPYLPASDYTASGEQPSSTAALLRGLGAIINDDPFDRDVAITPGRSFRSDVKDWGLSGEVNWDFGAAELTSITAYRYNKYTRGQDADFNNLDILYRDDDGAAFNRFKTFTQELRLQGEAFGGRLDWLVGAFYANEKLRVDDNLSFGADADIFARSLVQASSPLLAAFPGYNFLNPFTQGFVANQLATNPLFAGVPALAYPTVINAVASQVVNTPLSNMGLQDSFEQESNNFALFTHNIFDITDRLSLTIGLRHTWETKKLDADLNGSNVCANYLGNIARLQALAADPSAYGPLAPAVGGLAGGVAGLLTQLAAAPCVQNSITGEFEADDKKEREWSGTAVLSYKPTDRLLTYLSYSKGYKAGGFNLDRAGLTFGAVDLNDLEFAPEKVDAYEAGAKYNGNGFDVNVAVFREDFKNFQLNTFNGVNFVVENINSCSSDLGGADEDADTELVPCGGKKKAGVRSQGIEIESFFRPTDSISAALGASLIDTKYRKNLIGAEGLPLIPALFQLPGERISNSSYFTLTGSIAWRPRIGNSGMRGLLYIDGRHQSKFNTGSDLDREKLQKGYEVFNARIGLHGPDDRWGVELWSQNIFNEKYLQVGFDAPLQGSGTKEAVDRGFITRSTQLFGAFLAEPRTYGLTLRGKLGVPRRAAAIEEVAPPPPPPPPAQTQTCADGTVIEASAVCPPPPPPPPPVPAPERG